MPRYSILTPVHLWNQDRVDKFLQTIKSVENQTFRDFEWVIVNDGSVVPFFWDQLVLNKKIPQIVLLNQEHKERIIAYNEAFKVAKGEWFTLLDSDDEYTPDYLEKVDKMIKDNPQYKMFNFGCVFHHKDSRITRRDPFQPKKKKVGHEMFGPGNIVNGTFVFHRSIYDKLGSFPGDQEGYIRGADCTPLNYGGVRDLFMGNPWDFSAACQLEFPEIRKYFMVDHENEPNKIIREIGNPWGQDAYLFFKYTRKFHSLPVKEDLYIVHIR